MGADKPIARRRRALAAADRERPRARRSGFAGATSSSATRTWSPTRSRAAAGLRADRARLRPGDARLPRGRRRAARRARRPAPPRGPARRARRDERQAAHALAAKPPSDGADRVWRDRDERRRPRASSRRSPASCSPSSATTCHPDRPRWLSTTRSECFATGACAAASEPAVPGPVRGRRRALGHDPAAADARRPPRARDPARDPLHQPADPGLRAGCASTRGRRRRRSSTTSAGAGTTSASTRTTCSRASRRSKPFNTTDAVRAFYELYADKHGKPRWGDKTPDYIRKMKKIQKTLPEARFIHVIRDGRDAGLSQNTRIAKRGKDPVPPREMARRWRKRIVKARDRRRGGRALHRGPLRGPGHRHRGASCGGSASSSSSTSTR